MNWVLSLFQDFQEYVLCCYCRLLTVVGELIRFESVLSRHSNHTIRIQIKRPQYNIIMHGLNFGRPSQIPPLVNAQFHKDIEDHEEDGLSWPEILALNPDYYKPFERGAFKNRHQYLKNTKATKPKLYWKIYAEANELLRKQNKQTMESETWNSPPNPTGAGTISSSWAQTNAAASGASVAKRLNLRSAGTPDTAIGSPPPATVNGMSKQQSMQLFRHFYSSHSHFTFFNSSICSSNWC